MKIFLAGEIASGIKKQIMKIFLAGGDVIKSYTAGVDVMKIFLAGTERLESDAKQLHSAYLAESYLYQGANILQSFYYASEFTEKIIIPNCKSFLLDSGAFTFMQGKRNPDWNKYVDDYAEFINKNDIQLFFELDIDNIVGFDSVLDIRKQLEKKTGKKPIAVWHKSRGFEQFKRDANDYPYVAIGGIVTKEIKPAEYDAFIPLIQIAHQSGAKIHGLGFTRLKELQKYHFDSVDSTTWVTGNRFGKIYYFDGKTIQIIDKPDGKRVKTNATAVHNFMEWKKFCEYADKHL